VYNYFLYSASGVCSWSRYVVPHPYQSYCHFLPVMYSLYTQRYELPVYQNALFAKEEVWCVIHIL